MSGIFFLLHTHSYIWGTKWLRHQKWVLNWRFFCENLTLSPFLSNSLPLGVQKNGENLGADLPPQVFKGLKSAELYRISLEYLWLLSCVRGWESWFSDKTFLAGQRRHSLAVRLLLPRRVVLLSIFLPQNLSRLSLTMSWLWGSATTTNFDVERFNCFPHYN